MGSCNAYTSVSGAGERSGKHRGGKRGGDKRGSALMLHQSSMQEESRLSWPHSAQPAFLMAAQPEEPRLSRPHTAQSAFLLAAQQEEPQTAQAAFLMAA